MMLTIRGLQGIGYIQFLEDVATYLGLGILLTIIAIAVYYFIIYGSKLEKYEHYEKEIVDVSYEDKKFLKK